MTREFAYMDGLESALDILRRLGKKHGRVLPLSLVFKTFLNEKIYSSAEAIVNCLRALQKDNKIKPINFGIDIELLESTELKEEDYVQSSLDRFQFQSLIKAKM